MVEAGGGAIPARFTFSVTAYLGQMRSFNRQKARRALHAQAPTTGDLSATNRKIRRSRRRLVLPVLPEADLGWVAGLLESKAAWVGPDLTTTIRQQPRVLTQLRRRLGGFVKGDLWIAEGRKAEAILYAALDRLVTLEAPAVNALALADYRRRNRLSMKAALARASCWSITRTPETRPQRPARTRCRL